MRSDLCFTGSRVLPPQHRCKNLPVMLERTGSTAPSGPPVNWSVFGRSIRTNNDLEGWHNALNRRANGKSQLPFYLLIDLLHKEAKLALLQIRLVSEKKLKRIQRRKYRQLQNKIFCLWDQFNNGEKTARQLLKGHIPPEWTVCFDLKKQVAQNKKTAPFGANNGSFKSHHMIRKIMTLCYYYSLNIWIQI